MINFEKIIEKKTKLAIKLLIALLLIIGSSDLFAFQLDSEIDQEKLLNTIKYDKNQKKRLESYINLSQNYLETLHPETNIFIQDGILLAKQLNNYLAIIKLNLLYAKYYYYKGDIEESTYKIKEALLANEQINNKKWFAEIYLQLGENYRVAGAHDLAYDNFIKSFNLATLSKDTFLISSIYNRIATYFFENQELLPKISRDSSIYYANLSLNLCRKLNNIKYSISNYNLLGLIYRYKFNNLDTSEILLNKGLEIALKYKRVIELPRIYYNIARGHFLKNKIVIAKEYIDKGFSIADSLGLEESKLLFYQLYSNYYYLLQDFKNAYDYTNLYTINYKKSQDNKSSFKVKSALNELQYRNKEIEQEAQQQIRNFLLIISALIILFIISIMIVLFMRNKQIAKSNIELVEKNKQIEEKNLILDKQNKIISEQNIKLEESNASKDKLFSIISHDLKNPIGSLKEMISVLADKYDTISEEERREILQELKFSSDNVLELLLGLLTWSRSQQGKIEYDPYVQDIYQLVFQNIAITSSSAKSKNINIVNSVAENTAAFFDTNMINTVLRNLLTNAIKFTNSNGKIEIKAEPYYENPNFVMISVADNGTGIPQEKLEKLFKIKHSFTTIGTSGEKGTGLGLLIVWDFIEKNNGKIWVESQVGQGTTFYFTLPINEQHI